ncbi:hypothetical protein [Meridianimarinicoccus sp. MJW13]|uniref:hypothetical protein n=2 Tax=unclassified Meridianimarinicoccus TaxID=2923344 RepID=UPI001865CA8E|nr:hypothetical protein [Fluviibacterium sp. MJW13]
MKTARKSLALAMTVALVATGAHATDQYGQVLKNRVSGMGLDPSPIDCMSTADKVELNSALTGGRVKNADKRSTAKFLLSQAAKKC